MDDEEVCTGVQFVTAAFHTVCSHSCQQEKTQSLISVKDFDPSTCFFFFALHCFMQVLDPYCWYLGLLLNDDILKLETRLLLKKKMHKIASGGVKATNCNAQARVSECHLQKQFSYFLTP